MFVYHLVKWASDERDEEEEEGTPSDRIVSSSAHGEERATGGASQLSPLSGASIIESANGNSELQSRFDSAAMFIRSVTDRLDKYDLLYLYARYKQATIGPADARNRPGVFDWKGREKFDSWARLGNAVSREDAMRGYINKVHELNLGWQPSKKYTSGFGIRPSTLANSTSDEDIEGASGLRSDVIEWFSAVSMGNLSKVSEMLKANNELLVERDENQVTAMHHAADRGNVDMIECLLQAGADISIQDYDGQTPLHYAVSCSHRDAVEALLRHGADPTIADFEGNCAVDVATDQKIKDALYEVCQTHR